MLGFVLFQLIADFCGNWAATFGKLVFSFNSPAALTIEIVVRFFFFLIQTALLFVSDEGVSPLKLKILLCVWLNCAIKTCSVEANPFETCIVLWIAIAPLFSHYDSALKASAEER